MQTCLHTLTYFSRNDFSRDTNFATEIEAILFSSRNTNQIRGITGALLYTNGWFAQVLEGDLADVEWVFEKLAIDSRHRDLRVIDVIPIAERNFAQWSMFFAGDIDTNLLYNSDKPADPSKIGVTDSCQTLISLLKHLAETHEPGTQ